MIIRKVILSTLLISLSLSAQERFPQTTRIKANLKGLNQTIKEKIEKSPLGDYAWLITIVGFLSGAIYFYRTHSAYSKLAHHEYLQTRFINLIDAFNTYKEYIDDLYFPPHDRGPEARRSSICFTLHKNFEKAPADLERLYTTIQAQKATFIRERQEVTDHLNALRDIPQYQLLLDSQQRFSDYYGLVISTLEELTMQIPYMQAVFFLKQYHMGFDSNHPVRGNFVYTLSELNYPGRYPLMAFAQDLSAKIERATAITHRLQEFRPYEFQELILQKMRTAPQMLTELRDRVVHSPAYAEECETYKAELRRQELERQRQELERKRQEEERLRQELESQRLNQETEQLKQTWWSVEQPNFESVSERDKKRKIAPRPKNEFGVPTQSQNRSKFKPALPSLDEQVPAQGSPFWLTDAAGRRIFNLNSALPNKVPGLAPVRLGDDW